MAKSVLLRYLFLPGELFICLFRIAYEWFIYTASKDSIEEK